MRAPRSVRPADAEKPLPGPSVAGEHPQGLIPGDALARAPAGAYLLATSLHAFPGVMKPPGLPEGTLPGTGPHSPLCICTVAWVLRRRRDLSDLTLSCRNSPASVLRGGPSTSNDMGFVA